jgi:hypothetical protein
MFYLCKNRHTHIDMCYVPAHINMLLQIPDFLAEIKNEIKMAIIPLHEKVF